MAQIETLIQDALQKAAGEASRSDREARRVAAVLSELVEPPSPCHAEHVPSRPTTVLKTLGNIAWTALNFGTTPFRKPVFFMGDTIPAAGRKALKSRNDEPLVALWSSQPPDRLPRSDGPNTEIVGLTREGLVHVREEYPQLVGSYLPAIGYRGERRTIHGYIPYERLAAEGISIHSHHRMRGVTDALARRVGTPQTADVLELPDGHTLQLNHHVLFPTIRHLVDMLPQGMAPEQ